MAFVHCSYYSSSLGYETDLNVIIPSPGAEEILTHSDTSFFYEGVRFPVLYLLHGAYGDYSDWSRKSNVELYANQHRLCVVMASAENSFYQDMDRGNAFDSFITKEVPEYVERLFPVSKRMEDRYIAGLSMGGYGALHLALEYPERYFAAITLSGAVDMVYHLEHSKPGTPDPFPWQAIFKNTSTIPGSDADVYHQIEQDKKEGKRLPFVFQSCGTEDFLHEMNKQAFTRFKKMGLPVTYDEDKGIHDWKYWDASIQRAFTWLDGKRGI